MLLIVYYVVLMIAMISPPTSWASSSNMNGAGGKSLGFLILYFLFLWIACLLPCG